LKIKTNVQPYFFARRGTKLNKQSKNKWYVTHTLVRKVGRCIMGVFMMATNLQRLPLLAPLESSRRGLYYAMTSVGEEKQCRFSQPLYFHFFFSLLYILFSIFPPYFVKNTRVCCKIFLISNFIFIILIFWFIIFLISFFIINLNIRDWISWFFLLVFYRVILVL
jgi:hypothetical protein